MPIRIRTPSVNSEAALNGWAENSDKLTAVETVTGIGPWQVTQSETGAAVDTPSTAGPWQVTQSETGAAVDTPNTAGPWQVTQSETGAATDTVTGSAPGRIEISWAEFSAPQGAGGTVYSRTAMLDAGATLTATGARLRAASASLAAAATTTATTTPLRPAYATLSASATTTATVKPLRPASATLATAATATATTNPLRPASATLTTSATTSASATNIAFIRPASDVSTGSWTTNTGGTSALYAAIDETAANDSDYIVSPELDVGDSATYSTALAASADPESGAAHMIYYRVRAEGTADLTVSLKQGATVIASWSHTGLPASWTTYEQALTSGEANSITDYTALSLEFEAAA